MTTSTIFVCVKQREGKKASCAGSGSRELLAQLKETSGEQIEIRPCGCLKKCKKGPAVAVFQSKDEGMRKPPKKAWKRADAKFKRASVEDVAAILKSAEALLKHRRAK